MGRSGAAPDIPPHSKRGRTGRNTLTGGFVGDVGTAAANLPEPRAPERRAAELPEPRAPEHGAANLLEPCALERGAAELPSPRAPERGAAELPEPPNQRNRSQKDQNQPQTRLLGPCPGEAAGRWAKDQ